jgi:hypothetical protein
MTRDKGYAHFNLLCNVQNFRFRPAWEHVVSVPLRKLSIGIYRVDNTRNQMRCAHLRPDVESMLFKVGDVRNYTCAVQQGCPNLARATECCRLTPNGFRIIITDFFLTKEMLHFTCADLKRRITVRFKGQSRIFDPWHRTCRISQFWRL